MPAEVQPVAAFQHQILHSPAAMVVPCFAHALRRQITEGLMTERVVAAEAQLAVRAHNHLVKGIGAPTAVSGYKALTVGGVAAAAAGELRQQPVVHLDLSGRFGRPCIEMFDDAADVRMQLRRARVIVDPQYVEARQNSLDLGDVERRPVSKDGDGRLRQRPARISREIEDSLIKKRLVVVEETEPSGEPM